MPDQVKNGDTVRVHYTGRLDDGQVFDSSEGGDPLEFRVGAGEVIPGFDDAVRGMEVGDRKRVEIPPAEGYGERREQLIAQVPRESMELESPPEAGMSLLMQLPDGNQIPVTVTDVNDDQVTLDANHPLAGQKLTFDVELVENKKSGE